MIVQFDRTRAAQPTEYLRSSELDHALAEIRVVRQVALRFGNEWLPAKAGETILDVRRVADLAGLAIADNIDADGDLTRDYVGDGLVRLAGEFRSVVGVAVVLLDQQVDQGLRPWQTANMGCQDAVGAESHGFLRLFWNPS